VRHGSPGNIGAPGLFRLGSLGGLLAVGLCSPALLEPGWTHSTSALVKGPSTLSRSGTSVRLPPRSRPVTFAIAWMFGFWSSEKLQRGGIRGADHQSTFRSAYRQTVTGRLRGWLPDYGKAETCRA
jgi:hypothetical protein